MEKTKPFMLSFDVAVLMQDEICDNLTVGKIRNLADRRCQMTLSASWTSSLPAVHLTFPT